MELQLTGITKTFGARQVIGPTGMTPAALLIMNAASRKKAV